MIVIGLSSAVAAIATAIATLLLWRVTAVLAEETKRLANATGQPQIVVTIRPNQWTMMYADLIVTNSGNASAFEIKIDFDPAIKAGHDGEESFEMPLQNISLLRPGESLSSDVGRSYPLLDQRCRITTSWKRNPTVDEREELSYDFTFGDIRGTSQLGAANPLVKIADEVKHIRDDWKNIAAGHRKLIADIFTSADRTREKREREGSRKAMMKRIEKEQNENGTKSLIETTSAKRQKRARKSVI